MIRFIRSFRRDDRGAMAVFFAAALPVLVLTTGVALDYVTLARSKSRMQGITDAAALAANNAKVTTDAQALQVVNAFVQAQISPDLRIDDTPAITVALADGGRTTQVVLTTNFRTRLMSTFRPLVPYQTTATVKRGLDSTVELALVLDTTNSMTTDNKIGTLKVAANNLVDILMKDAANQVSISVVPFAQYVNVGTANRNATWLTRSDDYSVTGAPVCTPQKTTCATYTDTQVCQTSVKSNCRDVTTTTYNDGVPTTKTTQQCDTTCTKYVTQSTCSTWNYADKCTSPVSTYKWTGCVGSRSYPLNLSDDQPGTPWPALYNNTSCSTELLPLSTDKTAIKAKINGLTPSGETYMPSGLVWGLNALSRTEPLSSAQPYDPQNRKPRKALVFMTDGMNTKSMTSTTSSTHTGTNTTLANTYTTTLCSNIKAKGIEIYTISLMVTDTTAMQMLKTCATDAAHSFDATDANALKAVFEAIAFSLQRPYLSN